MNEIRKATYDRLVSMGFSRLQARSIILYNMLPTPLTEDNLENYETLIRYIDPAQLWKVDEMQAAYFLRRPVEEVRFMIRIPDLYAFNPEETERYFSGILEWYLSCDLRTEIGEDLAHLLPDSDARERIYREMYLSGAWWPVDYLRDTLKALTQITVDPTRMSALVNTCYTDLFSFYSDTVTCIRRLEEIFRPECIQAILEHNPVLPRVFSPHFDLENDRERAIRALVIRFPEYLRVD